MKEPKTIRCKHLYDAPEIYSIVYSRSVAYKTGEAAAFANILERVKPDSAEIFELFSGSKSRHRDSFLANYSFRDRVSAYVCADGASYNESRTDTDRLHVRDLVSEPWGRDFDAVIAFYYTPSSVSDWKTGLVTRARTSELFANCYRHLRSGGVFVFDACNDGFETATAVDQNLTGRARREHYYADYNTDLATMLRDRFSVRFRPGDPVELDVAVRSYYDRMTANNIDHISTVQVSVRGRPVLRYEFKQPFCQRYFSEPELVDMLQAAGFGRIELWHADYLEHDIYPLDARLTYPGNVNESDDSVRERVLANVYVAHK